MISRISFLFLPSLLGLVWNEDSGFSIVWSLAGSIFIALVAQTRWFRQTNDDAPITHRLLRPVSIAHVFFVGFHVVGGAFHAMDAVGYTFWGRAGEPLGYDLALIAEAQRLMLLAHTGLTAGMKLAGFRYDRPKYVVPFIPPYGLIVASFLSLSLGTLISAVPSLWNFGQLILSISSTAIVLDTALSIRRRHFTNIALTLLLLGFNLVQQVLSGWKGLVLYSMITLGALLYPLMPRRVVLGGTAFLLFWTLYLHPFGLALRPLIWYEGVEQQEAVAISMDRALGMSIRERLDSVWTMMVGRANDLYQFQKYITYVPAVHPYFQLDLVKESLIAMVPRVLWPEKPDLERLAMQRVYEAGVVSERARVSAKSNFYQDAYLSGGAAAVVLACFFLGMLTMFISHTCERLFSGYDIGTCLIYTSLFSTAINAPLNFLFFVGTIGTAFFAMFGFFFLGRVTGWIVPAPVLHRPSGDYTGVVEQPALAPTNFS